jgi:release factor glutamine methyltransferase
VRGTVDGIVANPPYLAEHELAGLPVDVRDHEPRHALVAGPAGTEIVERIALEARYWLRPGGFIALEINEFMGEESRELFSEYGAELIQDLNGRDRFVLGHGPARRG